MEKRGNSSKQPLSTGSGRITPNSYLGDYLEVGGKKRKFFEATISTGSGRITPNSYLGDYLEVGGKKRKFFEATIIDRLW